MFLHPLIAQWKKSTIQRNKASLLDRIYYLEVLYSTSNWLGFNVILTIYLYVQVPILVCFKDLSLQNSEITHNMFSNLLCNMKIFINYVMLFSVMVNFGSIIFAPTKCWLPGRFNIWFILYFLMFNFVGGFFVFLIFSTVYWFLSHKNHSTITLLL